MQVKWLISQKFLNHDLDLRAAFDSVADDGQSIFIPVDDTSYESMESTLLNIKFDDGPVVFYGSIAFVNTIRRFERQQGNMYFPGVWAWDSVDCTDFYGFGPRHLFLNAPAFCPFGLLDGDEYGAKGMFIRPNSSKKSFPGQVVKPDEFETFKKTYPWIQRNDIVVLAEPKNIVAEHRYVIANGSIASSHAYGLNFRKTSPYNDGHMTSSWQFVDKILSVIYIPDLVFTLDVAIFGEHGYQEEFGIVEYNSFNTSGLYFENYYTIDGRDTAMRSIVKAVDAAAWKSYKEIYEI